MVSQIEQTEGFQTNSQKKRSDALTGLSRLNQTNEHQFKVRDQIPNRRVEGSNPTGDSSEYGGFGILSETAVSVPT
jgi:hypothetical protein